MKKISLSGNLNKLQHFCFLIEECNVSKAAEKANISQWAMSHALKDLREWMGDPILVHYGNKMNPFKYRAQFL